MVLSFNTKMQKLIKTFYSCFDFHLKHCYLTLSTNRLNIWLWTKWNMMIETLLEVLHRNLVQKWCKNNLTIDVIRIVLHLWICFSSFFWSRYINLRLFSLVLTCCMLNETISKCSQYWARQHFRTLNGTTCCNKKSMKEECKLN